MKKLALVLAALATVSAVASAKEVVAAPVVAVEPVTVVCPEPVLPTPEWKPSGYVQLTQRYYGHGEQNYIKGKFSRSEFVAQSTITEKDKVWFRSRFYQNYISPSNSYVAATDSGQAVDGGDRFEMKWFHDFGKIWDEVEFTSIVAYEQRQSYKRAQVFGEFDVTSYMGWTPEMFKNSFTALEVGYRYQWASNTEDYYTAPRIALYTSWNLPLGFTLDVNGYVYFNNYSGSYQAAEGHKNANDAYVEAFLNKSWTLAANDTTSLKFNFVAGLDDYGNFDNENSDGEVGPGRNYYELMMEPHFRVDHKINKSTNLFATAGGEYRNFKYNSTSDAKDWRWRPIVGAGFRTTF